MRKNVFLALSVVLALVSVLFWGLFDYSVTASGLESVKAWLKGEENSIAQGNLLTSVTKTQKILLSSEFIKGIVVYEVGHGEDRVLIEFGNRPQPRAMPSDGEDLHVYRSGFLSKEVFLKLPNRSDLLIGFSVYSETLALLFWITVLVFSALIVSFSILLIRLKRKEAEAALRYAKKASDVAHDLAQPLLALNTISLQMNGPQDSVRSLKAVIHRITNIVEDLGMQHKTRTSSIDENLETQIRNLILEKQTTIGDKPVTIDLKIALDLSPWSGQATRLLRSLSNLIDNSLEAISSKGRVLVSLERAGSAMKVRVEDTGKGIPSDILLKVGKSGFSFGKSGGNGLGVAAAKDFAEEHGGKFEISSVMGVGTTVTLQIPGQESEKNDTIFLTPETVIAVLDDEDLCLRAMRMHFDALGISNQVHFFSTPLDFENFLAEEKDRELVFLFSDFEMKTSRNGLDVIEGNQLQRQAVLVTGRAQDESLRRKAANLGVPVFDKVDLEAMKIEMVG